MAPLRVMFAIPVLDHAGPDRVIFELLAGLDRTKFEPILMVARAGGYYYERLPSDVRTCVLGEVGSRLRDRYPLGRALRAIWREQPDVVIATLNMIIIGIAAPMFPRKTKLIVRPANDFTAGFAQLVGRSLVKHRVARELSLGSLRQADAIVCQSEAMRSDLGGYRVQRERMHVIGNPVDVDAVARVVPGARPAGNPALVSVGRLGEQKGFDLLLPAIASVRARFPELHLTILGDGPDRAALVAQARALGIEHYVTFAGFVSEPLPIVRAADLFVLASRWEGFPNAALEALACGTPVVLTGCPGANAEIVVGGTNGRLATSPEPAAVARAVETALDELARYDRSAIQDDCRRRFGRHRIVGAYQDLIAEVAA